MLNQVQIIGHLGRDPESRTFSSGDKVTNIRVATTESWKDRSTGERREKTEWHSVAIFGPAADYAAQYLSKGSKVFVQGKLSTRKWQDNMGQDRYTTEIVVRGFQSQINGLDRRGSDTGDGPRQPASQSSGGHDSGAGYYQNDMDDEIPF